MAVSVLWYILQEAVELYLYSILILVTGLSEVQFRVYNRVSDFKIVLCQSEITCTITPELYDTRSYY